MTGFKLIATLCVIALCCLLWLPIGSIVSWIVKEYRGDHQSHGDSGNFPS